MFFKANWNNSLGILYCYLHHCWEVDSGFLLHLVFQVVAGGLATVEQEFEKKL